MPRLATASLLALVAAAAPLPAHAGPRLQDGTPLMIGVAGGAESPGISSPQPPFVSLMPPVRAALRARAVQYLGGWMGLAQADVDPLALALPGYAPPAVLGFAGAGHAFGFAGGSVAPFVGVGGVGTAQGGGFGPAIGLVDAGEMGGGIVVYATGGLVWPVVTQGALADPVSSGTWPPFDTTVGFSQPQGPGRLHVEVSLRVGPGARAMAQGATVTQPGNLVALLGLGYAPGAPGGPEPDRGDRLW